MVKNKKNKKGKQTTTASSSSSKQTTTAGNANNASNSTTAAFPPREELDDLQWLRECELRRDSNGEPYLQLEYQPDDELIRLLQDFLAESVATKQIVQDIYQIWQQTVLSTLLASSALWKKENVTAADQRQMKDHLKLSRYKINFIMHHAVGSMLTSNDHKWIARKDDLLDLCHDTLQLLPRLADSCPHHKTDIRQTIIHFEGKEFLSATACETWDTLYDYAIPIDNPDYFIPILRRCAMLDILDKDWNMLGGWEEILKGLEAKCFPGTVLPRLVSDAVLHEQTTILRNARNSMQCKFFSVRFMRYTEDQAPQRWRYFPKCSAPACAHIETPAAPHKYRCKSCWYFHYCSAACQEYCDNIMSLHGKFCKDTPASKAALCRKETEQYLGWPAGGAGAAGANGTCGECRLVCRACGAVEDVNDTSASSGTASSISISATAEEGATNGGHDCNSNNNNNDSNSNKKGSALAAAAAAAGQQSKMKRCQQCRAVCYCSRQCQEWDWRVGGHKKTCKPATAAAAESANSSNQMKELVIHLPPPPPATANGIQLIKDLN